MKKGWQTKKLREVCELVNGRAYSKPELLAAGKYRVLRVGNFFTNDHWYYSDMELEEKKYCDTGDLLYAWSASFGPRMWTGGKVIYHYHIWKVVHDSAQIDQKFLFYFFQWDTEKIKEDQGTGTTMMHVSMGSMNERDIQLPPLAEQQRIVGLLDEAFEGLATAKANAQKNLQNARALFESHLQSVFTQRGPGWVETTLGEIGKVSMCKRIFKEETTATGDIPFYKIGTFGKDPDAFIPSQTYNEYRAKYSFPKKGDVLISAAGTIGRRVRYDGEPAYFQDSNIVWIENDEKQALNDYLYHFYGACDWNSTKGATIPRLYNDNLRRISIRFPKSVQEQRRIVSKLDALSEETQRLARLYERKIAALEALKKSLLHQAFTGEL